MIGRALPLLRGNFSRLVLSPSILSLSPSSTVGNLSYFSSEGDPSRKLPSHPTALLSPEQDASSGVDDVSSEELKRRIDKYMEGDMEAIPSIFEAILQRKLSGKHDHSDDELMDEIRSKMPQSADLEEDEDDLTSDDEFYETGEDSDVEEDEDDLTSDDEFYETGEDSDDA